MSDVVVSDGRRDAGFWREEMERFSASGQSMTAYCRARGFALSTFSINRKKLANASGSVGKLQSAIKAGKSRPVSFIELQPMSQLSAEPLRIILASGITLEVPQSYNPEHLAQILVLCRAES
jgi:hypothetical protein